MNAANTIAQMSGTVTVSVTDFGADGFDSCSDHDAFVEAAKWFNDRGGDGTLVIPAGEYIVGKQIPNTNEPDYDQGENVLSFFQCSNLQIIGEEQNGVPLSILRFDDCMEYGAFETGLGGDRRIPICDVSCITSGPGQFKYLSDLGAMIFLEQCSNVVIRNLELNGNIDAMSIGGKFGESGIQASADGIWIASSGDVSVGNVDSHHHGRDGIGVTATVNGLAGADLLYGTNYSALMNISLRDCNMEWNSRLGMSLGSGNGITAEFCKFNWNGAGETLVSSPAAGVDIEYHSDYDVRHTLFTNCEFKFNKRAGLLCDAQNYPQVEDHRFVGCSFVGSDNGVAAWPQGRAMRFTGCKFAGEVMGVYNRQGSDPVNFGTVFEGCSFSDEYSGMAIGAYGNGYPNGWLLNAPFAGGLLIDECLFESRCGLLGLWIKSPIGSPQAEVLNSTWVFRGESSNVLFAEVENTQMPGFEIRHPSYLNYGQWYSSVGTLINAGAIGISTNQPPIPCAGLVHYEDPPEPSFDICYAGTNCGLVLSEPRIACDNLPGCVELVIEYGNLSSQVEWAIQSINPPTLCNGTIAQSPVNTTVTYTCYLLEGTQGAPINYNIVVSAVDGGNTIKGWFLRECNAPLGVRILDNEDTWLAGATTTGPACGGNFSDFSLPVGDLNITSNCGDTPFPLRHAGCEVAQPQQGAFLASWDQGVGNHWLQFFSPNGVNAAMNNCTNTNTATCVVTKNIGAPTSTNVHTFSFTGGRVRRGVWLNMRVRDDVNNFGPVCKVCFERDGWGGSSILCPGLNMMQIGSDMGAAVLMTDFSSVEVWPNPTIASSVNIRVMDLEPLATTAQFEVLDGLGRQALVRIIPTSGADEITTELDLGGLAVGLYQVIVRSGERVHTQRLMVE